MKNGVLIMGGDYPLGSSALRKRMIYEGLKRQGIKIELLHYFPAITTRDSEMSESYVKFFLPFKKREISTQSKINRSILSIFPRVIGILNVLIYLEKMHFDFVLMSSGFFEGLLLRYYTRARGAKLFIERGDENRRRYFKKKRIADYLAIWYEDLFDKFIIQKCDHLFVVSKYLEKKYSNMHVDLIITRATPSFVDMGTFIKHGNRNMEKFLTKEQIRFLKNDSLNITFCGSYVFHNGLNFFLECASSIMGKDNKYFQIVLVIFKGHITELKHKIDQLGLSRQVLLVENINGIDIPSIYNQSDILVLPEMGIEVANAGFPGKVAEYLASGKAIISTEFSNLTDYLHTGENVLMSTLGDKEKYCLNLRLLLKDKNLRKRLGENARRTAASHFSLSKGVQYLVDSINS
jgi:glycosyltransferase involved in cell wall biosynthesis